MNYLLRENIIETAKLWRKESPELREGQSIYLASMNLRPKIVKQLIGTEYDCFYIDNNIDAFLEKVCDDCINLKKYL